MNKCLCCVFFIAFFTLISCNNEEVVFNNYMDLPGASWSHKDSVAFDWEVTDSTAIYDLTFQLRTTTSYKWSNIYIFSDIFFPNGKARRDTFEFYLADPKGQWLGDKSGLIIDYKYPLYKKIRFPEKGIYKFTFHQAMRDSVLHELMNVGMKVTKPIQ